MYTIHEKRQKCNFVLILTSDRYKKNLGSPKYYTGWNKSLETPNYFVNIRTKFGITLFWDTVIPDLTFAMLSDSLFFKYYWPL